MLQRWVHAFRESVYHAAVNTNNGVEAQNKLLKYNFLPHNKQTARVSDITTLLVEDYLPSAFQKYLLHNYKQTSSYRTYNDFVPNFFCVTGHEAPFCIVLRGWPGAISC